MEMVYFYVMVNPDVTSRCKIGVTKNLKQRLRSYRTANPQCYFERNDNWIGTTVDEKYLLDMFTDITTVDREYVHLPYQFVKNVMDSYFDDLEYGS